MIDTRLAVLTLPYDLESIAKPRELIVDMDAGAIYVKSTDGATNIQVGQAASNFMIKSYRQNSLIGQDTNSIEIIIPEFNATNENDLLQVYIGGIYKTLGIEYELDGHTIINLESEPWHSDWSYDLLLLKNIHAPEIYDYIDGSMISLASVGDEQLSNSPSHLKYRSNAHMNNTEIHTTQNEKNIIDDHINDNIVHVTQMDKDRWNDTNIVSDVIIEDQDIPGQKYKIVVKSGNIFLEVVSTNEL